MPRLPHIPENFRRIRSILFDLLGKYPEVSPPVAEVLKELENLEQVVGSLTTEGNGAKRQNRRKTKTYRIEQSGPDEFLAEYRPDDVNPFRCPRNTYDALARALAKCDRFVKYDELLKLLDKHIKPRPADYQIRLALRFWAQPEIDLIERARARYRPQNKKGFQEAARRVWQETVKSS